MKFLRKTKQLWDRARAWWRSRKVRKVRRAVGTAADATAAGAGFVMRLAAKVVLTVFLIFITTGLIGASIFAVYVKTCLSDELGLTPEEMSSNLSSHVWARDGDGWVELETLYATENRVWVDYDQIPKDLEHAAVAIEDKNFYTHKGVDWWRTLGAFGNMFLSMQDTFGGSTITQQFIKNATGKDQVTVQRKLLEIFQALDFEKKYTKEEIMTFYLNKIYLSEGCYGVGAAAKEYFNKDVSDLNLVECACLISITNNPSLYDPYISMENNTNRRNIVLRQMYEQGYIDYEQYSEAITQTPTLKRAEDEARVTIPHSYYVDSLIWEIVPDLAKAKGVNKEEAEMLLYNGGYNIYTCMDRRIQNIVDNIYQNRGNLPQPSWHNTSQDLNSAIVVMEPYTGEIVALAGGTGEKTGSFTNNYATELPRPPGSSFKPVAVYAPALDLGLITQDTPVNDSPGIRLSNCPNWYPKNDGGGNRGWTTVRGGVISSLNTVAAQVLNRMGLQASWTYLTERFGFTSLVDNHYDEASGRTVSDYVYPALALGQLSYGVTCKEMAQAYTAFVNDGVMSFGRTYSLITDSEGKVVLDNPTRQQVAIKANTAWNIDDMLQAAVQGGTGTMANFSGHAVAGKTGTTSNNWDRYFTGFTRYYVAACWTGYDQPTRMYFYSNPAAQIWRMVMSQVHEGLSYWGFNSPDRGGAISLNAGMSSGGSSEGSGEEQAAPPPAEEEYVPPVTDPPVQEEQPPAQETETPSQPDPPVDTGGEETPPTDAPVEPEETPVPETPVPETPPPDPPGPVTGCPCAGSGACGCPSGDGSCVCGDGCECSHGGA